MNFLKANELARRFPEVFATLREYIEKLERENTELRERLEILAQLNEKQTEEYICVDREHGLWKLAAIDAARKKQP
jgi:hypothetical protein